MAVRCFVVAILVGLLLGTCAPAPVADERAGVRHETMYLLHADARDVALMFATLRDTRSESRRAARTRPRPAVGYPSALPQPLHPEATPDPSRQPELAVRARVAHPGERFAAGLGGPGAVEQFGGLAGVGPPTLLPGDMAPPIPIPGENALLVTGTPAEIDAFRELVQLLDTPQPQVRIRTDIVNVLTRIEEGLGLDLGVTSGPVGAGTAGNVPPDSNLLLRFGTANAAALLGAMQRQTRGAGRVSAEVMTMNYVPAFISAGQTVPFFVPETIVTFGAVTTNYVPYSAFVGMELWVLPRVNADDTVTMHIRPSLIDQTGMVLGPGGAVPVTKQTLTDVLIRVRDGETVCIGGLPRRQDSTNTTPLGTRQIIDDSELLVFVTPTILRPIAKP